MSTTTETTETREIAEFRAELAAKVGKVWNTTEMIAEFEAISFLAPIVMVRERATGKRGTLEFVSRPRFYFRFVEEG